MYTCAAYVFADVLYERVQVCVSSAYVLENSSDNREGENRQLTLQQADKFVN